MALQDLTPQLRTRLNRMERAVGWFVFVATLLLLFGFGYFIYKTATRKGWFISRAPYYTYSDRATGLKEGDPVMMMGFPVGQITKIEAMPPGDYYEVYIEFEIKDPYNGYLWTSHNGSRAKVLSADFLGKRVVEVTKGTDGYPAYSFNPFQVLSLAQARAEPRPERWIYGAELYDASGTNLLVKALTTVTPDTLARIAELGHSNVSVFATNEIRNRPTAVWVDQTGGYTNFIAESVPEKNIKANKYWLVSDETPAITERLENMVDQIQKALPSFFAFTNQIALILSNSVNLTSNLNGVAVAAQPAVSNLTFITGQLRTPGSLGDWALGPVARQNAEATLGNASLAIARADTNLTATLETLAKALEEVAGITSNLHAQVDANTNILGSVSKAVVDADDLVQGLKRHWLLRSAFKPKPETAPKGQGDTNHPPAKLTSPRDPSAR